MFLAFVRILYYDFSCFHIYHRTRAPKKHAKVLLFFELTKYFLKKMQKIFIFLHFVIFTCQKMQKFFPQICIYQKIVVILQPQ